MDVEDNGGLISLQVAVIHTDRRTAMHNTERVNVHIIYYQTPSCGESQ